MNAAFDSTDTARMADALDRAFAQLGRSGRVHGETEDQARAALARAIIEASDQGERDAAALTVYALSHYGRCRASILDRDRAAPKVA